MTLWFDDITVLLDNEWDPMNKDKVTQINIFTKLALLSSVVTILQTGRSETLNMTAYVVCISAIIFTFGRFLCEKNEEHFTNSEKKTNTRKEVKCSDENPMGNRLIGDSGYNNCLPTMDSDVVLKNIPLDPAQIIWENTKWPFYKVPQPTRTDSRILGSVPQNQSICKEASIFSHLGAPSYAYRNEACKPPLRTPLSNS